MKRNTRRRRRRERLYGWLNRGLGRVGAALDIYQIMRCERRPKAVSDWDSDGVTFLQCEAERAGWLAAYDPTREPIFAARLDEGWRCFAVADEGSGAGGRCVAYVWITVGPREVGSPGGHFRWRVPAAQAMAADAWAHPLALGLYPDLVRFATARLWDQGIRTFWGSIEFNNRASRLVHRALSARPAGWTMALRWGRWGLHCDGRGEGLRLRRSRTAIPLAAFAPAARSAQVAPELTSIGGVAGEDAV